MGCTQSKNAGVPQPGNMPNADALQPVVGIAAAGVGGTDSAQIAQIGPDPDLGWRTLPPSVALPALSQQALGHATAAAATAEGGAAAAAALYPASWTACFFNDRSGYFCTVSIVVLALNIAIRAESLARRFGVSGGSSAEIAVSAQAAVPLDSAAGFCALPDEDDDDRGGAALGGAGAGCSSSRQLYQALRIPDYGWRLVSRDARPAAIEGRAAAAGGGGGGGGGGGKKTAAGAAASAVSPRGARETVLQLLRRDGALETGGGAAAAVRADVASIGMNIAEQLYRLERKSNATHELPTHDFGWRVTPSTRRGLSVAATSPDGEALWIVPEEIIFNVTEWVQHTYFTSAALHA